MLEPDPKGSGKQIYKDPKQSNLRIHGKVMDHLLQIINPYPLLLVAVATTHSNSTTTTASNLMEHQTSHPMTP